MKDIYKYENRANSLIYGGLIILGITILLFVFRTTEIDLKGQLDTNIFDHFGSFIGGLLGAFFSLAGVYLLILNLKGQEIDIKRQQIENRFFELVRIHRDNCDEVKIQEKSGREVFKWLQREFYKCYETVKKANQKSNTKISKEEIINASYISFYFGAVGQYSSKIVKTYLNHLDDDFLELMLDEFKEQKNIIAKNKKFPFKLFDGHQSRLGHYYRHLFQTIKYIDKQPNHVLDFETKYEYVKTLRAQLTTQEQVLFFFNSLSSLGRSWEKKSGLEVNQQLITKYNLIKNIPEGYVSFVNPREIYPDVRFEGQPNDTKSKEDKIKNYR